MNNNSKPLPWVYYGIFLDEESKKALLERAKSLVSIPDDWKIFCDHCTIVFNDCKSDHRQWITFCEKHLGEGINFIVDSIGVSQEAVAFGIDFRTDNRNSHITVACAPGVPPVRSNSIKDWRNINHFTIHGTFGVVRPK